MLCVPAMGSLPVVLLLLNGTRYSIVTGNKEAIERIAHVSIYICIYMYVHIYTYIYV